MNPAVDSLPLNTPAAIVRTIIDNVAARHAYCYADIVGTCRHRRLIKARFEAIREVHARFPAMSSPQIGRIFNRDHTTILSALGGCRIYPARAAVESAAGALASDISRDSVPPTEKV